MKNKQRTEDEEMDKSIAETEAMLEERRCHAESIVASKPKEMTKLIMKFEKAEDGKAARMKKGPVIDARVGKLLATRDRLLAECEAQDEVMKKQPKKRLKEAEDDSVVKIKEAADIDAKVGELQAIRARLLMECESRDEVMKKLSKKIKKLEAYLNIQINSYRNDTSRLETEFRDLKLKQLKHNEQKDLFSLEGDDSDEVKATKTANLQLLGYIDRKIEVRERELECPVCLEVASVPIYMCDESHLICFFCRPKVRSVIFHKKIRNFSMCIRDDVIE